MHAFLAEPHRLSTHSCNIHALHQKLRAEIKSPSGQVYFCTSQIAVWSCLLLHKSNRRSVQSQYIFAQTESPFSLVQSTFAQIKSLSSPIQVYFCTQLGIGVGACGAEETQSTEEEEKVQRETTKEEEKRKASSTGEMTNRGSVWGDKDALNAEGGRSGSTK